MMKTLKVTAQITIVYNDNLLTEEQTLNRLTIQTDFSGDSPPSIMEIVDTNFENVVVSDCVDYDEIIADKRKRCAPPFYNVS